MAFPNFVFQKRFKIFETHQIGSNSTRRQAALNLIEFGGGPDSQEGIFATGEGTEGEGSEEDAGKGKLIVLGERRRTLIWEEGGKGFSESLDNLTTSLQSNLTEKETSAMEKKNGFETEKGFEKTIPVDIIQEFWTTSIPRFLRECYYKRQRFTQHSAMFAWCDRVVTQNLFIDRMIFPSQVEIENQVASDYVWLQSTESNSSKQQFHIVPWFVHGNQKEDQKFFPNTKTEENPTTVFPNTAAAVLNDDDKDTSISDDKDSNSQSAMGWTFSQLAMISDALAFHISPLLWFSNGRRLLMFAYFLERKFCEWAMNFDFFSHFRVIFLISFKSPYGYRFSRNFHIEFI